MKTIQRHLFQNPLDLLILFLPLTLAGELLHWPALVVFILTCIGIIPMAAYIGKATESLAHFTSPRVGGLLNATLGNAAELIITITAIRAGLLELVKASITGSILGNLLLVMGFSFVVGGTRHGHQVFDQRNASRNAILLVLAVLAMLLPTSTHRPTFTLTFTPTLTPVFRSPTPTFLGPTPLWMFLASTYTPTPLYVTTQHPSTTRASFEAGLRSLALANFDTARIQFKDVLKSEPNAVDVYYFIGESFRMQDDFRSAKDAYQEAIDRDPAFAPAFLGRALANQGLTPNADILLDLDEAINLDPGYSEAFIARGAYLVERNPSQAKKDLLAALKITPNSPLAYLYLSDAELNLGENEAALESATHANSLDMTLVPVYLSLARAYLATGQTPKAVSVLKTYTLFMPEDASAFMQLGTAYNAAGEYQAAVEVLNKAIDADRSNPEAYFQRGTAYINLDTPGLAEADFKAALRVNSSDFDAQLGLARAFFMQGKPGDAYIQAEQNALPLAKTDNTKAQCYYWEALFLEKIPDQKSADAYWNRLIRLPGNTFSQQWRDAAFNHLKITPTYTPTLSPTKTLTRTTTPSPTRTPTIKPATNTPTKTP